MVSSIKHCSGDRSSEDWNGFAKHRIDELSRCWRFVGHWKVFPKAVAKIQREIDELQLCCRRSRGQLARPGEDGRNVCCRNLEKAGERDRGLPGGGTPRFVGHARRSRWSPCVGGGTAPRPSVASPTLTA